MNIKLLRKIQRKIKQEPKQFIMGAFFIEGENNHKPIPNCGTAACIAGWALAFNAKLKFKGKIRPSSSILGTSSYIEIRARACKLLDITEQQGEVLFNQEMWPEDFKPQQVFFDHMDDNKRADIACKRIDYFIETGK